MYSWNEKSLEKHIFNIKRKNKKVYYSKIILLLKKLKINLLSHLYELYSHIINLKA